MPTTNKNIDFDFFNRSGRFPPKIRFNMWGSACGLSVDAYKALGKPLGLKVGIDKENRKIHVLPVTEKNVNGVIYLKEHHLNHSKVIISRARIVLDELRSLCINENIVGTVNSENGLTELVFKF